MFCLAIANAGSSPIQLPRELMTNTAYTVVTRYNAATGENVLWVVLRPSRNDSRLDQMALVIASRLSHVCLVMNSITNLLPAQLRKAADIQEKIQSLQKELRQLLGNEGSTPAQPARAPKKGKMSAAGRAAIRAAQKARWATIKNTTPLAKPAKKAKKRFSTAARAALAAAARARWAKVKAAGKTRL
jgi:hypothetical protein